MNTHKLEITRQIKADPARVYKAFTNKSELEQWFCPEGMTRVMEALELKVGGAIQVTMKSDEDGSTHTARGVFKEIVENEKLVFTWECVVDGKGDGEETLITVTFEEKDGGTALSFIHSEFVDEKTRDMHNHGWESAFNRFDKVVG